MNNKNKTISFDDKMKSILNFIKKSSIEKIKDGLLDVIKYNEFCPKILGSGVYGTVYIPNNFNSIMSKINDEISEIPIVIKEANKINTDDELNYKDLLFNIQDNTLLIKPIEDNNLITELLILIKIREIYDKTLHLPLLLGYGTCKVNIVDRLITKRFGLQNQIKINLPDKKIKNNVSTLRELFEYINYKKNKDGSVKLPNGLICNNIIELFDYIVISYLTTHILLCNNGIYPHDMHYNNIFIHWLNENSFYKNNNIQNLKEVIYKINNKYFKIKTLGFLIILGDTGCFTAKFKNNVIIPSCYLSKSLYELKINTNAKETINDFISAFSKVIPYTIFKNTTSLKITNKSSFTELYKNYAIDFIDIKWVKHIKDVLPSNLDILELFYDKYGVKNFIQTKNNILIDLDE